MGESRDKASGDLARKGSADLYVGKDGNVYRRTNQGWAKYGADGEWDPVAVDRTRDAIRDGASAVDREDFEKARARQQTLRDNQQREERDRQERFDAQRRDLENLQRRQIEQQQRLQRQPQEATTRAQSFQSNQQAVRSLQQEAASRSRGNYRAENFQSYQLSGQHRGGGPRGRR